jgi:hypothetical protein
MIKSIGHVMIGGADSNEALLYVGCVGGSDPSARCFLGGSSDGHPGAP